VKLTADQTVVLDARKAKPVTTSVPKADAVQANSDIGFDRKIKDGVYTYSAGGFLSGRMFTYNAGPKLPADQLIGHVTSQWGIPGEDGFYTNTPYLYGIANYFPGDFPTGFDRKVKQSDLATVDATVNSADGKRLFKMLFPTGPNGDSGWARVIRLDPARTIRYYVDETPYGFGGATEEDSDGSDFPFGKWSLEGKSMPYKAGRYYRERWNAAAFVPSVYAATRSAGQLGISLYSLTDADGHTGQIELTGSTKLYRDGAEIGSTNRFGYVSVANQPAGKASYKLVTTGTQQLWPFSTRMDLESTFTSSADQQNLPIHTVGFRPDVDGNNTMARTPVTRHRRGTGRPRSVGPGWCRRDARCVRARWSRWAGADLPRRLDGATGSVAPDQAQTQRPTVAPLHRVPRRRVRAVVRLRQVRSARGTAPGAATVPQTTGGVLERRHLRHRRSARGLVGTVPSTSIRNRHPRTGERRWPNRW